MQAQQVIGGFFELEIPRGNNNSYHPNAYAYTSGRACLGVILEITKPRKIYLPYYSCEAVLQPLRTRNVAYEYYRLDSKLEFDLGITTRSDELLLYINYFGLKTDFARLLGKRYGSQLIIDNTQAFFEIPDRGDNYWSFNSARKFFGVPDGAYLYGPCSIPPATQRNTELNYGHLVERLTGNQAKAYELYVRSEANITDCPYDMSILSERILTAIDYCSVKRSREENFAFFHRNLADVNRFPFDPDKGSTPFCYPLLLDFVVDKRLLAAQSIYLPTYWPNIPTEGLLEFAGERKFVEHLLPLPVDHRYDRATCHYVYDALKPLLIERPT
jgi:hypothetical protein